MSARHLASAGIIVAPRRGVVAGATLLYVGSRYLNKRNTALADGYATMALTGGYRFGRWEVRVDVHNVTDERPPVAESELGDAQYYRLPARELAVALAWRF
jgi:outer membrane receptor protein involved in Fe transport